MKRIQYSLLGLMLFSGVVYGQSFEEGNVPANVKAKDNSSVLSISPKYFKDGQKFASMGMEKAKINYYFYR